MGDIKHYFQKEGNSTVYDLESYFSGLKYSKCEGLETRGARKNIYTEEYADSDTLRVWQGSDVTRTATTITFTLYFTGDKRQATFDSFYEFVKNGKIFYWDTKRLKKAYLVLKEEFEPSEDIYHGSTPYKAVNVKFQNLWGECKNCNNSGELV